MFELIISYEIQTYEAHSLYASHLCVNHKSTNHNYQIISKQINPCVPYVDVKNLRNLFI